MIKLDSINRRFKRFGELLVRRRAVFLALVALLCAFGVTGIGKVVVASQEEDWFDPDDPIRISGEEAEELFGNSSAVTVLFQAEDVFAPEVLRAVKAMGEELLEKVPYADKITSLADLELSVGTAEGMEIVNPFGDGIPDDPAELARLKALVLGRPSLVNRLVSDDAKETWLVLSLHEFPPAEAWKKTGGLDPLFQTGEAALAVFADPKWKSGAYTFKAAGMPVSETEERDFFGKEAASRVFLGFLAMTVLLALMLRSLRGVLVPVFTTGMAIVVVFGGMGHFGIKVDSSLMTLPVILGMALSVGYSIHVFNAFRAAFRRGGSRKAAAIEAVSHTGWPVLFTMVTTAGSMLAFLSVSIGAVRWLGLACAAVVGTVYVFVFTLIPITLSFGRDRSPDASVPAAPRSDAAYGRLADFVLRRRAPLFAAFAALLVGAASGLPRVGVNIDLFDFVGLKVPYVARLWEVVNSRLGSFYSYDVVLDFGEPDAVKDAELLSRYEALLREIGRFPLTKRDGDAVKISSILDIVKDMNRTLNGDDPAAYAVPAESDLVSQLLFLYEVSGGTRSGDWADPEFRYLRARVEVSGFESAEFVSERDRIVELCAELFPDARVSIVGAAMEFAHMNGLLVTGQLKSFSVALVVIALLLMLVFFSVKTGLIGLIPNIVPVLVSGGIMGYAGYQLDMMTMIIMPMVLGIAVDDTIHMITELRLGYDRTGSYRLATRNAFVVVGRSMLMTTLLLVVAFAVYLTSPVATLRHIGLLASVSLLSALAADYLMTPILISTLKPFGEEREGEAGTEAEAEAAAV